MVCILTSILRFAGKSKLLLVAGLFAALAVLSACSTSSMTEGLQSVAKPKPAATVGSVNQSATAEQTTAATQAGAQAGGANLQADGQEAAGSQMAAAGSRPVTFLPVSNAPQTAVTRLARSIRSAAASHSLALVASVQAGAHYQVKGYFSALEDGSGTLLVYVWDVLDRNDKRVYRISGQEQTAARSADPWGAISTDMLDRVARSTVAQLQSWLASRG